MSGKLMGEVFSLKLSEKEQLVLLALADHAKDDGTGARPGVKRICWKTSFSPRTVERYLSRLRKAGIIEKVGGGGNNLAVEYKINIAAGEKKPPFAANDETESAANYMAGEGKSAKDDSAANYMAGEQPNILPENNHSAAKSSIIQPPKRAHSAARALAAQPLTVIEPLPLPAKRRALNFPETVKSEVVKTRARETGDAAETVFIFWKETFDSNREFNKNYRRKIEAKFREGFTVEDLKAAVRGYKIAAPEESHNVKVHGNFSAILSDVEKFRRFDAGKSKKGEK